MVDLAPVAIGAVAVLVALWYCTRMYSSLQKYQSVGGEAAETTTPVEGTPATVEGPVTVDEPAPASNAVESLLDAPGPLALYDWRIQSPQGKNRYGIDLENRTITRKRTTIEAGVEASPFLIEDGAAEYCIDPQQLVETGGGPSLATIETIDGSSASSPLFGSDWATKNLYLEQSTVDKAVRNIALLTDAVNETQANQYRFGARGIPDGGSVAVHGEVTIDDGVPTVQGTEETPLLISDRGIEGLRAGVRTTLLKHGVASAAALLVGMYLIYSGIWSPPI